MKYNTWTYSSTKIKQGKRSSKKTYAKITEKKRELSSRKKMLQQKFANCRRVNTGNIPWQTSFF